MLGAFVMIDKILVVYNKINMFTYLCRGGEIGKPNLILRRKL